MNGNRKSRAWVYIALIVLFLVPVGRAYFASVFARRTEASSASRTTGALANLDPNKIGSVIVVWPELKELQGKPITISDPYWVRLIVEQVGKLDMETEIYFPPDRRQDKLVFFLKNGRLSKQLNLIDLNHGRDISPVLRSDHLANVARKAIDITLAKSK